MEYKQLFTGETVDFSFTYAISDITDPSKRKTGYSKTIRLPASKIANEVFEDIFEVQNEQTFNPNIRTPVSIYDNGAEVFRGDLKLMQITTTGGERYYECLCVQEVKTLYHELRNTTLGGVDLSALNHSFTLENVSGSWANVTGYIYPYIDYGYNIRNNALFQQGGRPLEMSYVAHWRPAVYVKEVWDKLFEIAGFTYDSDFIEGAIFTKLISPAVAPLRMTSASVSGNVFIGASDKETFGQLIFDRFGFWPQLFYLNQGNASGVVTYGQNEYDPGSNYNGTTFTAPFTANYRFCATLPFEVRITEVKDKGTTIPFNVNGRLTIVNTSPGSVDNVLADAFVSIPVAPFNVGALTIGDVVASGVVYCTQPDFVSLLQSSETKVYFSACADRPVTTSGAFTINSDLDVVAIEGGSFYNTIAADLLPEGATVDMNQVLPPDMKATEFLNGIIKAFNLYVDTDPNNPRNLIIEPRNDYYSSGTVVDWSEKVDRSKPITVKPCSEFDFNKFAYKYRSDSDYYNSKYNGSYEIGFGDRLEEFVNEWTDTTRTTELPFSATPLVGGGNAVNGAIIPRIYYLNDNGQLNARAHNMRILYYGGLVDGQIIIIHTVDNAAAFYTNSQYPYAGHLDNPITPTLDLNFDIPKEVYYSPPLSGTVFAPLELTDNNLFNKYHRSGLREITDENSRVVTMWMKLDGVDIVNLNFADTYYIDGVNYRLLTVKDYIPNGDQTTECEFLKVIGQTVFTPNNEPLLGGTGQTIDNRPMPIFGS